MMKEERDRAIFSDKDGATKIRYYKAKEASLLMKVNSNIYTAEATAAFLRLTPGRARKIIAALEEYLGGPWK